MRKHIIASTEPRHSRKVEEWLNLVEAASVEVSSEDPQHPIESAFKHGETLGWRAAEAGAQKISSLPFEGRSTAPERKYAAYARERRSVFDAALFIPGIT
jgi:hypothetical protein